MRHLIVAAGLCLGIHQTALSQDIPAPVNRLIDFPTCYISKVRSKFSCLDKQLTRKAKKYLQQLAKKENQLKRKLSKIDAVAAQQVFGNVHEEYTGISAKLKNATSITDKVRAGEYLPLVDSIKTSLLFLHKENMVLASSKEIEQKIRSSLDRVNQLQSKLQQSEQVKAFILYRKQQIKEALGKYTKLPKGITNSVTDFNKQAYYYGEQIREYKDILKDPDRMVQKGLLVLNKLPAFKQFMSQHSELASLFNLPDNYGAPQSLTGLQTRAQVQQQIQTQLANGAPNAQQYLQQNLQAAQAQLNQLKDKINKGGEPGIDMPDFKPNNQKTKTLWQRLEYGANIQSVKSGYFFPTTTDIGLSLGYKLNGKSILGIGASYKMGWGKDIRHISITSQGIGFRSFLDMKIKGSFYASGGFEYNYQPLDSIPSSVITGATAWKQSGLIGVSKVISLKTKFFKKTKLQLLWDFLSYQQVPRAEALKFRVNYHFN